MCNCSESGGSGRASGTGAPVPNVGSTVNPLVPLAGAIEVAFGEADAADQPPIGPVPVPIPPIPPLKLCRLDFREGCYKITIRPSAGLTTFEGTLRVDRSAPDGGPDNIIVSGDLYSIPPVIGPVDPIPVPPVVSGDAADETPAATSWTMAAALSTADQPPVPLPALFPVIPIFPRRRYHSYLKVTSVSAPIAVPPNVPCQVTLVAEQFFYTQPPVGQHKGTFPAAPSRTITLRLTKVAAPFPFSLTGGPFYQGSLFVGGVNRGAVTLGWVSKFFRRATLEIDTLKGAVPPAPVPGPAGGTEFFDTIFARTGWLLSVNGDQLNVPVPGGVTPTNCWSSPDLHALMSGVRNPATDLDREWRVHLVVVPARLGCSRGVMYDQIGVPREGCASFSDDGYPVSDSSNFGVAANQKQRDIPRAYLRSATHEVTHTLNQIHQESETTADNSIMTTTPSVADVLGGPGTGAPGVFPDQIALVHNATVRHHLNHMPDPVIRPGGWPFASWFPTGAPQASDRLDFASSELALDVTCESDRVALGQPLAVSWTLTNRSAVALRAPNDVSIEALFATITIVDGDGRERPMRAYEIICDHARLEMLEPGESVSASARVFWSTSGFAFERPGRYQVNVAVSWSAQGVLIGAQDGVEVFVDYPASDVDNRAAGLVMHEEVGKWVVLGGGAYHLPEACRRLWELTEGQGARDAGAAPRLLQGFGDVMPDRARLAKALPELMDEGVAPPSARAARAPRATARKTRKTAKAAKTTRRR
jgi:hypothetical protein